MFSPLAIRVIFSNIFQLEFINTSYYYYNEKNYELQATKVLNVHEMKFSCCWKNPEAKLPGIKSKKLCWTLLTFFTLLYFSFPMVTVGWLDLFYSRCSLYFRPFEGLLVISNWSLNVFKSLLKLQVCWGKRKIYKVWSLKRSSVRNIQCWTKEIKSWLWFGCLLIFTAQRTFRKHPHCQVNCNCQLSSLEASSPFLTYSFVFTTGN